MEKLTASLEDYLEIICNFENSKKQIKAKELHISRASVTEALKKLADKGLVNYGRYETISLTNEGKNIAQKVVSKHAVLQQFFEQVLDLSSEEASYNACKIEHIITDNAFAKISKLVTK